MILYLYYIWKYEMLKTGLKKPDKKKEDQSSNLEEFM